MVFHSAIAAEAGWFTLADVARSIHDKLLARHLMIEQALGASVGSAEVAEVVALWESSKQQEHGRSSALDEIPVGLPALARALKVAKRATAIPGYVAPPVSSDLVSSDPVSSDLGAALLQLVDLAQERGWDPEEALRQATDLRIQQLRTLESPGSDSP
ncbi:unannotated protein [freshwater metagenome]|uniref:Unannotated protein n=1 Tax=freshwater metagenome TaxID=449393 RepID=A0A6J7H6D2_9ZZZZ